MISLARNALRITSRKQAGLILGIVKFKAKFKQHLNLMILTWFFVHLTMASNSYAHRVFMQEKSFTDFRETLWHT